MRYVIETDCEACEQHHPNVALITDTTASGTIVVEKCGGSGGSRRVVTPTPMIRMGGLTPAWYVQDEDDTDEPDGWLIQ